MATRKILLGVLVGLLGCTQTFSAFAQLTPPITPPANTAPPVISAIVATSVSSIAENVTWITDKLSVSTFQYGTTMSYGSSASISASAAIGGTAALTGLAPATTYYYCIHATDTSGNSSNACGRGFTTAAAPAPVVAPPVISAVVVSSFTTSTASVTWATDKTATTQVAYGTTASYDSTSVLDNNLALTHSSTLAGLMSNTTYHYQVRSTDSSGNLATSTDATFTTASLPPPPQVVIPADTTPPVISGVAEASVLSTEATIAWSTDELAASTLEYGTTPSYGTQATLDAGALLVHTGTILNLLPSTTYYYCIHATDLFGNRANSCGHMFTTAAAPSSVSQNTLDTTPPTISLVVLASVATSTATVTWATDEVANGEIQYGLSANYGLTAGTDLNLALTHAAIVTGLVPNTTYHYRVRSSDQSGNVSYSNDETFTTSPIGVVIAVAPPADTTPPIIANIMQEAIASYDATVAWTTNELAISSIRWGTTSNLGSTLALDASAGLAHAGTLANLSAGTTYFYCIDATDLAGNTSSSCGHSFTTAAAPVVVNTTPPTLSLVATAPVGTSTATVTWTTGALANAQVEYGPTTGYGSEPTLDTNYAFMHTIPLSGLAASTTYHYLVKSSDQAGNLAVSSDNTFTTGALPQVSGQVTNPEATSTVLISPVSSGQAGVNTPSSITVSAVVFSVVEAQSVGTSTVTITWHTDLPSDSRVEYGVSSQLGQISLLDTALTTSHSVTLVGLQQDTNYIFRVVSQPVGAPAATVSGNHEFDTLAVPTLTTIPANVSSVMSTNVGTSTATISWMTDKNTTGQIFYGITTEYPQQSGVDFTMRASHSFTLTNLTPSVLYHYHVRSADADGNVTYSDDATFTMASISAPVVSLSGGNMFTATSTIMTSTPSTPASTTITVSQTDQTSATLRWSVASNDADAAQIYDIRYNTAPITENNFVNATQDQATAVTYDDLAPNGVDRTYIIAGLNPDTTYYFAVKAKYPAGGWSPISNAPSGATLAVGASSPAGNSIVQGSSNTSAAASNGNSEATVGVSAYHVNAGGSSGAISGPISSPTTITTAGDNGQIIFMWNDPNETSFVRTIVVRNANGYPASPADGQVIYDGDSETFTDTNVVNGTNYYYAFYSYDRAKNYSPPVHVSIEPQAGKIEVTLNETPTATVGVDYHFTQVLTKGATDLEVSHLQEMLVRYGFYPEKLVTSYFGSLTENALKQFQAKHGVAQTGVTDAKTQILLNAASLSDVTMHVPEALAISATDLQFGQTNQDIAELQQFLAIEGDYPNAQITGYFGPATQQAVIAFQKKYDIVPAVGYVGRITRHTIATISGF